MNAPDDNHLDLQQQLDEAGRLCRAEHPGWETLLDRLPPQEPAAEVRPGGRRLRGVSTPRPWRWRNLAMAASLAAAVVLGLSFWLGPDHSVEANPLPIEVQRRGIQVTIFSAGENREPTLYMPLAENPTRPSPGMALVKDQRMILHLQEGDNEVKFTEVAATIDPTSVRLTSDTDPLGTRVVEQNFEFDLASGDALLKRSIDEKITCVGRDGGELYEGYLLSFDGAAIVLADAKPSDDPEAARPKTETLSREKLQAIRLDHKPTDLYTRPTLVWKLRTDKPGDHLTTLTYLCGDAVWQADYVALVRPGGAEGDTIDLKAWVTIDNRSGTTYEQAGLKLIAGDVNRVRDPWAPVPKRARAERYFLGYDERAFSASLFTGVKEFIEKSFFEYKLYTLSQPSTIKDRQIKQLSLFETQDIKARRRYVCRSQEGNHLHPDVQLLVKNEKDNNLGRPLPKGTVTLTAIDPDGDTQMLGRQQIDHTAKDEEVELGLGRAFDVLYGYRVAKTQRPAEKQMICTYEFRIRNHKLHPVHVRAIAQMSQRQEFVRTETLSNGKVRWIEEMREATNWEIVESTDAFTKHDHNTVHFDLDVEADSEKAITYTVDYRW